MSDPWLGLLLIKMLAAASVVVGCSLVAERSGPVLAAMIATLPISVGPVLVFLALDHDAAFLAEAARASMSGNIATAGMVLVYVLMAQRSRTASSLGLAMLAWFAVAMALRLAQPATAVVVLATILVYAGLHLVVRPYRAARAAVPPQQLRYAIPMRAGAVALLAGTVTTLSGVVGAGWTGTLAAVPVVFPSLIVMLQPRIGGPPTAAIAANSALGLLGLGLALATVQGFAETLGSWSALLLGLLVSVAWNLVLIAISRRNALAAART